MFLTLVGLVALGVGGVGAGEAILAFLDRKRADIAILKTLGATGRFVFLIFFLQVMAMRAGRADPGRRPRRHAAFRRSPVSMAMRCRCRRALGIYPGPLLLALAFGLLSAVAFAVPPLSPRPRSAARQPVARNGGAGRKRDGRTLYLLAAGAARPGHRRPDAARGALAGFRGEFLVGAACGFWGCCVWWRKACAALLRRLPRPRSPLVRLALGQSGAPGRGHRRRDHGAGPGPDLARHRHLARPHHRRPGERRPARPRAQLLLCRHPARRGRRLRPHHRRLSGRDRITSARR